MSYFWENSDWIEGDRHLTSLQEAPFKRPFPRLPDGNGLFFIRGPRQIGKSTWLKSLLLKEKPEKAFYLSCENIRDHLDLAEVLKSAHNRQVLLFDEITFVDEWWRAIKHRIDENPRLRIVITGSHALDVRRGMDQMPGRWGKGGEFELLPMDFEEFSGMRKQAGWSRLERIDELELYFRVGGFPTSLIESGPKGRIPKQAQEVYRRWLLGDMVKLGKQETYLKELLLQVALTTTSTLSLQKLAQRTQIGSHNTALDYVEVLESCFALKILYAIDPNTGSPRFRKEKKFYLRDPLLFWMALEWAGVDAPRNANEQIAELVAHEHLVRKYKRFGYYTDRKGEVDFYSPGKWGIEVKWVDVPQGVSATYKNLHVPTKILWTKSNFLAEWPPPGL